MFFQCLNFSVVEMINGLKNIVKKVLGKEEYEEIDLSIKLSDGCEGEEAIAKIVEKIRGEEPC